MKSRKRTGCEHFGEPTAEKLSRKELRNRYNATMLKLCNFFNIYIFKNKNL